jgi:hypothetical protein
MKNRCKNVLRMLEKSATCRHQLSSKSHSLRIRGSSSHREGETTMAIPQGDLKLLDSDIAKRLLNSNIPARLAYIAKDGTPRVIPTWFYWDGNEIVMATFSAGPQVTHYPGRATALRANPAVAITIDTDAFPPELLLIRGQASVTEVDGLVPEFKEAARRYLGEEGAKAFFEQNNKPGVRMARIAVRPTWVGVIDFDTRLPSHVGGVAA